jgi:hypothetical protein
MREDHTTNTRKYPTLLSMPTLLDRRAQFEGLAAKAGRLTRGNPECLLELANIGDSIACLLRDESGLQGASDLLAPLLADTHIAAVIPLDSSVNELAARISSAVCIYGATAGRLVLLDVIVSTGITARRAVMTRGLDPTAALIVSLASAKPVSEVNGIELRVPQAERERG